MCGSLDCNIRFLVGAGSQAPNNFEACLYVSGMIIWKIYVTVSFSCDTALRSRVEDFHSNNVAFSPGTHLSSLGKLLYFHFPYDLLTHIQTVLGFEYKVTANCF